MKLIKLTAMLALALAMTFAATGCKRKVLNPTPLPGQRAGTPGGTGPQFGGDTGVPLRQDDSAIGKQPGGGELPTNWSRETVNTDAARFEAQTVYFALDSHQVRDTERMKLETVAAAMNSQPNLLLIIEGHCDERGTEEYNRALGSQRALSLREELVKAGISGQRILTETYGEDRPAVQGHNEAAWSKNRRGAFIAATPK
ncbi:MAG: hypothetical protein RLY20_2003 [Verrucomicrobiota bacterium]|jgi:peptidoglycan-associated lipoprotein